MYTNYILIYEGTCCCGSDYIGQTKRNLKTCAEHENLFNETEPARHLRFDNGTPTLFWKILLNSKQITDRCPQTGP